MNGWSSLRRRTPWRPRPRDTGPDQATRQLVRERDTHCCANCGWNIIGRPHGIQHRRARGRGGTRNPAINLPSNLILLCGFSTTPDSCNLRAERRDRDMVAAGFVVSLNSRLSPADVPVQHSLYGLVLLRDDGTVEPYTSANDASPPITQEGEQ